MARAPNEKAAEARKLFLEGMKLVDIARQLDLPEGTVRRWKSTHKWDNERSDKQSERSHRKKGAQPRNKNAEKHGFFSKYLPEETFAIIQQIDEKPPLDILWENIQIAYAAIIRAQSIMYVRDREDKTSTKIGEGYSSTGSSEKWEVQQAWDKQANFLKAQSRAQSELRSMIKQYEEMLHRDWELATEEQKARVEKLRLDISKAKEDGSEQTEDDGFLDAMAGQVEKVWQD